jgi:hypothetical protein
VTSILRCFEPKVEPGSWTPVRGPPWRRYPATGRYQVAKIEYFDKIAAGQFGIDLSEFGGGEHLESVLSESSWKRNAAKGEVPLATGCQIDNQLTVFRIAFSVNATEECIPHATIFAGVCPGTSMFVCLHGPLVEFVVIGWNGEANKGRQLRSDGILTLLIGRRRDRTVGVLSQLFSERFPLLGRRHG